MKKTLLLCSIVLLSLAACSKKGEPGVPAYIYVANILKETEADEGSASHNIKDAWISVNGQQIGVNNLPVLLPYIIPEGGEQGPFDVRVSAGIETNGLADVRNIYPFYQRHDERRNLEAGKIDTIFPVFRYLDEATVLIVEDFENPGVVFGEEIGGDTINYIRKTTEEIFEGNASGEIVMSSGIFAAASSFRLSNLQPQGTAFPVFVEFNYKSNLPVEIGIVAYYGNGSRDIRFVAGGNPRDGWTKLYIELTGTIFAANAQQYALALRVNKPFGFEDAKVYIDNIKLLYF